MGFLTATAERRADPVPMREATSAAEVFGIDTEVEQPLTREAALAVAAVWACVRLLSDTIATLPVGTYRRTGKRRREIPAPAWVDKPCPDMGRIAFLGMVMTSLLLEGNAYILVSRAGGRVAALDVIPAALVEPRFVDAGRGRRPTLVYELSTSEQDGTPRVVGALTAREVIHLRGLPLAGSLKGVSPLGAAASAIELASHAQDYGSEFFSNGALPGAVVTVPGAMTPTGLRAARATWRQIHGGRGNRHGLAVLTEGAQFSKISISPEESQFLQTRAFQVPEVARIFGVPPHLIADASGSTSWGSGLAEQNAAFAQHSVRVWVERLDEAFSALLAEDLRDPDAFVKIGTDAMTRASTRDRYEAYRVALAAGILSRDEVRALEDLSSDPSGLGSAFLVPSNMTLLSVDGPISLAAQSAPDPAPAEPDPADDPAPDAASEDAAGSDDPEQADA